MSEVAILVPVLGRPHRVQPLLESIAEATPEPHRVVFAASDAPTITELDRLGQEYLRDDHLPPDEQSWGQRINRLFAYTSEPYCFLGADDVMFWPDWLSEALRVMARVDGVVMCADLLNPHGTLPLVARRYILELGGTMDDGPGIVIHAGYRHNWADVELVAVAKARGRYAYAAGAVVEHLHPQNGKSVFDSTYELGYRSEARDHALFDSRRHLWEAASISTS
jgi:hypothetical protein